MLLPLQFLPQERLLISFFSSSVDFSSSIFPAADTNQVSWHVIEIIQHVHSTEVVKRKKKARRWPTSIILRDHEFEAAGLGYLEGFSLWGKIECRAKHK